MTAERMDFDAGISRCPCGRVTGNQWGMCTPCTDAESEDRSYWTRVVAADPNASLS